MTRFLDLNAVVRPDLRVELGELTLIFPGSISTPRMLRWMEFDQRQEKAVEEEDVDAVVDLMRERYDDLVDLARVRQPELESLEIDQDQMQVLFATLLGAYQEDAADAAPPSTPKPKNSPPSNRAARRASRS